VHVAIKQLEVIYSNLATVGKSWGRRCQSGLEEPCHARSRRNFWIHL